MGATDRIFRVAKEYCKTIERKEMIGSRVRIGKDTEKREDAIRGRVRWKLEEMVNRFPIWVYSGKIERNEWVSK